MKPNQLAFGLLCLLASYSVENLKAQTAPGNEVFVRAVSVNGEVLVAERQIAAGEKLKAGDKVITKKGSAKLLFPDRSLVDVGPASSFQIKALDGKETSDSQLDFGMVRALVKKKLDGNKTFTIRTGTSVLAVRGTEFAVSVEPSGNGIFKESVTVAEGRVDVSGMNGAGMISVNAGQQFRNDSKVGEVRGPASEGRNQVVTLKANEIKKQIDSIKVADQTFNHVVNVGDGGGLGGGPGPGAGSGSGTLAVVATEFKPPPPIKNGELDKAAEGLKPPPPIRPPEPSQMQQLNPEISDQVPVRLKVKFKASAS